MSEGSQPAVYASLADDVRWDDLEAFLHIYDGVAHKKLTVEQIGQAVGHSFGTPRTLYRRLARLETALNTTLVYRQRWSRETKVTPEGERLYEQLRHIMDLKGRLQQAFFSQLPTLRVATSGHFAVHAFKYVIERWQAREERLPVELSFLNRATWSLAIELVRQGEADLGLMTLPADTPMPKNVRVEWIGEPLLWPLMVAEDHRFAQRRQAGKLQAVTLEELREEAVVVQPLWADQFKPGVASRSLILVSSFTSSRPLVRQGVAVAAGCEPLERLDPTPGIVKLPLVTDLSCATALIYAPHVPHLPPEPFERLLSDIRDVMQEHVYCGDGHPPDKGD